jgi:hypothetical protein
MAVDCSERVAVGCGLLGYSGQPVWMLTCQECQSSDSGGACQSLGKGCLDSVYYGPV